VADRAGVPPSAAGAVVPSVRRASGGADRLEALWLAWEAQWPEPEARLGWFRDGLDHQLGVITADDGPLRECSAHEGQHVNAVCLAQWHG